VTVIKKHAGAEFPFGIRTVESSAKGGSEYE
jgi:hypothetical protein